MTRTTAAAGAEQAPAAPRASEEAPSRRRSRRWFWLRVALQLVLLAAAAVFLVRRAGKLGLVAHAFTHVNIWWVFVAIGLQSLSMVALSRMQQLILRAGDIRPRLRDLLPITLASNAVAQSLPAGVLFAEGYTFRRYQRLGASRMLAGWTELSAGALAAAALAAVGLAGAALEGGHLGLILLPTLSVVFAGALGASILFRRTRLLARMSRAALRKSERWAPERLCGMLHRAERATQEMACFNPSARTWAGCLLLGMVNWGLDAGTLMSGLKAVDAHVPWAGVLLAYAAGQLLAELPLTPGGIGFVEGGLVVILTRFHVSSAGATAGSLIYRGVSFWLLVAVGWVAALLLRLRDRRSAEPESPGSP